MQNKTLLITLLSTALLVVGCVEQPKPEVVKVVAKPKPKPKPRKTYVTPKAPKKNIKLKEVEDKNFSSDYMYPETDKKSKKKVKEKVSTVASTEVSPAAMTKIECLSMIGQDKFDKYAQMLGSDAGAIKKCPMLKAL